MESILSQSWMDPKCILSQFWVDPYLILSQYKIDQISTLLYTRSQVDPEIYPRFCSAKLFCTSIFNFRSYYPFAFLYSKTFWLSALRHCRYRSSNFWPFFPYFNLLSLLSMAPINATRKWKKIETVQTHLSLPAGSLLDYKSRGANFTSLQV